MQIIRPTALAFSSRITSASVAVLSIVMRFVLVDGHQRIMMRKTAEGTGSTTTFDILPLSLSCFGANVA